MESTDLIPLENNMTKNTRKAEEFRELHESLQRNLPIYLSVMMDALAAVHQKVKQSMVPDAARQMVSTLKSTKS
jgi:nuclear pore complex protein Nup93